MRPIDAEKLFDGVRRLDMQYVEGFGEAVCLIEILEMIAKAPIVDAAEKEAHWMDDKGKRDNLSEYSLYCSACGDWSEYRGNYCQHCGYKMDNPVVDPDQEEGEA